jgi:hypothetical protein
LFLFSIYVTCVLDIVANPGMFYKLSMVYVNV